MYTKGFQLIPSRGSGVHRNQTNKTNIQAAWYKSTVHQNSPTSVISMMFMQRIGDFTTCITASHREWRYKIHIYAENLHLPDPPPFSTLNPRGWLFYPLKPPRAQPECSPSFSSHSVQWFRSAYGRQTNRHCSNHTSLYRVSIKSLCNFDHL